MLEKGAKRRASEDRQRKSDTTQTGGHLAERDTGENGQRHKRRHEGRAETGRYLKTQKQPDKGREQAKMAPAISPVRRDRRPVGATKWRDSLIGGLSASPTGPQTRPARDRAAPPGRGGLPRDIIRTAAAERVTFADRPGVQIDPALAADRDEPPVATGLPSAVLAGLAALGRVNPVYPDALSAYLKRVAIDRRCRNGARVNALRGLPGFSMAMPGPCAAVTSLGVCPPGMRRRGQRPAIFRVKRVHAATGCPRRVRRARPG